MEKVEILNVNDLNYRLKSLGKDWHLGLSEEQKDKAKEDLDKNLGRKVRKIMEGEK